MVVFDELLQIYSVEAYDLTFRVLYRHTEFSSAFVMVDLPIPGPPGPPRPWAPERNGRFVTGTIVEE
jgi:hypothetical protein